MGHGARVAADLDEVVGARQEARREEAREEEIRDELMRSGGEEMAGLRLMLPRMGKEGDLFVGACCALSRWFCISFLPHLQPQNPSPTTSFLFPRPTMH